VQKMEECFHARLNAAGKLYEYRIDCGDVAHIFDRRYLYRIEEPLNLQRMREAAEYLTGTHDFWSFCANRHMKKSTVRTIYDISFELEDGILYIRYHGDGFLYQMVRILTGTLIEVGMGDMLPSQIPMILEENDRSAAGFTAPPHALFLADVYYEGD
ncbi:MAG: tRNA pseudouridine(38-40) synthase TruA, partial [Lachnospiraceae bacterium]|nr:tRNA pseudouridine(38-40) synthase TruA [Lachnospiraceae bacterium]